MFERKIESQDIHYTVDNGEILETYSEDMPFPSRLLLVWLNGRPLHVVAADSNEDQVTVIITVYEPDSQHWEPPEYRRRI
jgi:hypothetical protein